MLPIVAIRRHLISQKKPGSKPGEQGMVFNFVESFYGIKIGTCQPFSRIYIINLIIILIMMDFIVVICVLETIL